MVAGAAPYDGQDCLNVGAGGFRICQEACRWERMTHQFVGERRRRRGESMRTMVKFTISTTEESTWRAGEYIGEHGLASVLPNPLQVTEGEVVAHKAK